MPLPPRSTTVGITRRCLLLAAFAAPLRRGQSAESLRVRVESDGLRVSAPQLRFLTGKPLERIHNGVSLGFDFQLSALAERPSAGAAPPKVLDRVLDRFAVSYDLWEEKFSVSRLSRPARSVSRLSSTAAEAWCLDNLPLPTTSLPPERPFWLRLEVRAEDLRDRPALVGEPGISLTRLIELFSRPSRSQQSAWLVEDGPFRVNDLNKARGGRSDAV